MDALLQTGGQQTGGHHAALRGLLAKAATGQREANSQWKSEFGFRSRGAGSHKGADATVRELHFCLAGGVQSAGVAHVDKTWYSALALNCRGHLQQCLSIAL